MRAGGGFFFSIEGLEHRVGIEPTYTGFADLRVSRFATGALKSVVNNLELRTRNYELELKNPLRLGRVGH